MAKRRIWLWVLSLFAVAILFIGIVLKVLLANFYGGWPLHWTLESVGLYNPTTGEKVRCHREEGVPDTASETLGIKACIAAYQQKGFIQGSKPKSN
ncbi:MAG: hypothetical protein ACT4OG_03425 [Alphaproteobacteria bacterium]